MIRSAGWRGFAAALALATFAAPPAAGAAPSAEQLYLDALKATGAMPVPGLVTFKEDVTARNLHPVCSPTLDQGEFSVDSGGRRNSASFALAYYGNERTGTVEDLRTHEHCKGPGLFAPIASPDEGGRAGFGTGVHLDDIVGQTMRDERKSYTIAFDGEAVVDGARTWKLKLTPHDDAGDVAQKAIYVDQTTNRIREIWARFGDMSWAGGAHVDIDVHFTQVQEYWVVSTWSLNVNARALVVPLRYAFEARAYDYGFGARRQPTQTR